MNEYCQSWVEKLTAAVPSTEKPSGSKLKSLPNKQLAALYEEDPRLENVMVKDEVFEKVCKLAGFTPDIDGTADQIGGNSLCPLHFDVLSDVTTQAEFLAGKKFTINVPFAGDYPDEFFDMMLEAYKLNSNTQALAWMPVRENRNWFQKVKNNPTWKLVGFWGKGAHLFNKIDPENPFTNRLEFREGIIEPIACYMLNRDSKISKVPIEKMKAQVAENQVRVYLGKQNAKK